MAKTDSMKQRTGVSKYPKDAGRSEPGKFVQDHSSDNKRLMEFPDAEDNLPGTELMPKEPSRSGFHELSTHSLDSLCDGDEADHESEDSEAGDSFASTSSPVGPQQHAKGSRGY